MKNLSILLLQARHPDDPAKHNERQSFAERAGLDLAQIVSWDLLTAAPTLVEVRQHDALMVGGSGDFYVSKKNLPYFEAVLAMLREVVAIGHPMFASCFGFQMLVHAMGGDIVYDAENTEVGTYAVALSPEGSQDPLFGYLPATFPAQLGRKDRVARLPSDFVHLAGSERAPVQALRVPGQPIWATQFHPELTKDENLARFHRYLDGYAGYMSEAEMKETLARFAESPEAEELIGRFLRLVFA